MSQTVFLSTVTAEFGALRRRLAALFQRTKHVHVRHQDDFAQRGVVTLRMLQEEIAASTVVLHVIGAEAGSTPPAEQVDELLRQPELAGFAERFADVAALARAGHVTYTHWEAWLAVHLGKRLCSYARKDRLTPAQRQHVDLLERHNHYPKSVADDDALYDEIILTLITLRLLTETEARRIVSLPFPSLRSLFKGREEFLVRLRESLLAAAGEATAITGKAVHGLGGVGKTRLAVEYAWRHIDRYSALLFVVADSPENLRRNLAELVGPLVLNLPEQTATEEEARVAAAVRWLQDNPGWFLILDNVDAKEAAAAVEQLLPHLPGGHVLITSRQSAWSDHVIPLELDILLPEDAASFLLQKTAPKPDGRGRVPRPTDAADAAELAHELGGLALALEQAGAYIVALRVSLAGYLKLWRTHQQDVQDWHQMPEMSYPRSVAVTWQTTIDQLRPEAVALLNVLAWFAPEPIPVAALEAPEADEKSGASGLPSGTAFREVLAELANFNMIRWDAVAETVTVHRVVQEILRTRQEQPAERLSVALLLLNRARPKGNPDDVRTWPAWEPLRPHVALAVAEADSLGIAEPTSSLMNELGALLDAQALHADAEPLMRRALAIDEAAYGPDHPDVANRLHNLAQLLTATNRMSEAEPLMRRVVEILEKSYGADYPNVATALNNLAALLQDTNRMSEAEPLMRRALAIDQAAYGPDHPDVAIHLNNLAALLQATNRLGEAEPLMRRVVEILEKSYGADHPKVAKALNNLAQLLTATNRISDAEPLMRRALAIDEAAYGPDHPDVARDLNNLAQLLKATNRLDEAEPLMRRALAIDEAAYGPDHPDVARDLNNLALLLKATNRLGEAEPLMRRVVLVFQNFSASTGHQHPHMQAALRNYAGLLAAMNLPEPKVLERTGRILAGQPVDDLTNP